MTIQTQKIAIADCKPGIFKCFHEGREIVVKGYRAENGVYYYGYFIDTQTGISNPDKAVLGVFTD